MKTAVVLFNLGGPDRPEAIRPFLFNLFYDPAILTLRNPLRWCLARLISSRRAPTARKIYARMGGRSPIVGNTEAQAAALQAELSEIGDARVFMAMRYWHPRAEETVRTVKAYGPDWIVLLPLYPQYSRTTSGSSIEEWSRKCEAAGLDVPTSTICCYFELSGLIATFAERVVAAVEKIAARGPVKVIVSAHGLPERIIQGGDPYQWQVERGADALRAAVTGMLPPEVRPEWLVTYQSRATPEAWLKPDTEAEIRSASEAGMAIVVVPIAFVSEHSETLVELDIEYAETAERLGAAAYERVSTVDAAPAFVRGLKDLVLRGLEAPGTVCSASGSRVCPAGFSACPISRAGS